MTEAKDMTPVINEILVLLEEKEVTAREFETVAEEVKSSYKFFGIFKKGTHKKVI